MFKLTLIPKMFLFLSFTSAVYAAPISQEPFKQLDVESLSRMKLRCNRKNHCSRFKGLEGNYRASFNSVGGISGSSNIGFSGAAAGLLNIKTTRKKGEIQANWLYAQGTGYDGNGTLVPFGLPDGTPVQVQVINRKLGVYNLTFADPYPGSVAGETVSFTVITVKDQNERVVGWKGVLTNVSNPTHISGIYRFNAALNISGNSSKVAKTSRNQKNQTRSKKQKFVLSFASQGGLSGSTEIGQSLASVAHISIGANGAGTVDYYVGTLFDGEGQQLIPLSIPPGSPATLALTDKSMGLFTLEIPNPQNLGQTITFNMLGDTIGNGFQNAFTGDPEEVQAEQVQQIEIIKAGLPLELDLFTIQL